MAICVTVLAGSSIALSSAEAHRRQAVQMHFTHWVVYASKNGAAVQQKVAPGGTFRPCSSAKLTRLDAHYRASGADNLPVHTVWKVTGEPSNSEPGRMYPSGYFYILNSHGLPDGTWTLKVTRHGTTLGKASVTVAEQHC